MCPLLFFHAFSDLSEGQGMALPQRQDHGQRRIIARWWEQGDDWWFRGPGYLRQPGGHRRHADLLRQPAPRLHVACVQEGAAAQLQPDEDYTTQPGGG